jgi:hypothetical protein
MSQATIDLATTSEEAISLRRLCQPRPSVFDRAKADTVANIADFNAGRLAADTFFTENHVTEGMKVLLRQVFERLSGHSDQGVFRLMGGGKTHNMIAAGLLAGNASLRQSVLTNLGLTVDAAPVQVAAFDGRETDTRDFLWIHLVKQLNRQHLWEGSPGDAPGPSTWARLIGEQPTLIMLDEMPPFFVALGGRSAGTSTSQADILAVALANLMAAIMTNKLPRCCLVISDLAGVWAQGSAPRHRHGRGARRGGGRSRPGRCGEAALPFLPRHFDQSERAARPDARGSRGIPVRARPRRVPHQRGASHAA